MTVILGKGITRGKTNIKMPKWQRMLGKESLQWTARKPELGSQEKFVTVGSPGSRGAGEAALWCAPLPFGSDPSNVAWGVTHSVPNKFQQNLKIFSTTENQI